MTKKLDEVLRQEYVDQPYSVDEILCDPSEAKEFARVVASRLDGPHSTKDILKRLMALRKRGVARGGLPSRK